MQINLLLITYVTPLQLVVNQTIFIKPIIHTTNFGPYSTEYFQNTIDDGAVFISYLVIVELRLGIIQLLVQCN